MTAFIFALVIGAALGAYGATVYWQRELYHMRRNADRDIYDALRRSWELSARASDAEWKLATAYDLILARDIRARRGHDLPPVRTPATGSSTSTHP